MTEPRLHIRPRSGWLNDPNGPVHWAGRHHVFFQHNPAGPWHEQICWGHASSSDLVRWDEEPVALRPTPGGPDQAGCWSGCIVDDHGVATAVYTGLTGGPETATICLARSLDDDLRTWLPMPRPVAGPPPGLDLVGFRDPFVLRFEGHRYAVVGAGTGPADGGTVLVYSCDDLDDWHDVGPLLDTSDPVAAEVAPADIWECPQLFELGGRWVLLLSLVGAARAGRVAYLVGDLSREGAGLRFVPVSGDLVDHGHDFYAPAVLDSADRVLLWGWSWEDRPEEEVRAAGWAGVLTLTRELTLAEDGRLLSAPVSELQRLHGESVSTVLTGPDERMQLPEGPSDVLIEVTGDRLSGVSLELHGELSVDLDLSSGSVAVRRAVHEPTRRGWTTRGRLAPGGPEARVRIVIDGSVAEIYVEGGPTFTERLSSGAAATLRLTGSRRARGAVVVRPLHSEPVPRTQALGG